VWNEIKKQLGILQISMKEERISLGFIVLYFFLYILLAFFLEIEIIIYYYYYLFSNAKFYSIFFLNENCFENNCPNTLDIVFCF
jgi:hypothetical protein